MDRRAGMLLKNGSHQRRIESSRKENAHRHIGNHAQSESVDHQCFEFVSELVFRRSERIGDGVEYGPVSVEFWFLLHVDCQPVSGWQLEDVTVDAARGVDVTELEVLSQCRLVD